MIKHATNFILVFLLIFTPLSARKVKVDLSESKYGLEEANRQGLLSSRLRIVLDSIHSTVNADDEVVILLPKKAVWQFHSTDAAQREVYISNHDQDQPKCTGTWHRSSLSRQNAAPFDGRHDKLHHQKSAY